MMKQNSGGLCDSQDEGQERPLWEATLLEGLTPAVRLSIRRGIRRNWPAIVMLVALHVVALVGIVWYARYDAASTAWTDSGAATSKRKPVVLKQDGTLNRRK